LYTVIIFLARNGRTRAVKFRPINFGRISFDLGEISPIQQILRLSNGRNSPKLREFRPKFLRANLNCADSPISNKFRPKKNYCVCLVQNRFLCEQFFMWFTFYPFNCSWSWSLKFLNSFHIFLKHSHFSF
jgi:hypothetical protein